MRWQALGWATGLALGCVTLAVGPAVAATPTAPTMPATPTTPAMPAGTTGTDGGETTQRSGGQSDVRLLGEQLIPKGATVDGTDVGELSGIDYDRHSGDWYLISDDTERAPARFLTADLDLDERGLYAVDLRSATSILRTDGSEFPPASSDDPEVADPESIRWDHQTGSFWWSSEGKRDPESGHRLIRPWVRQMTPDGEFIRQIHQSSEFRVDEPGYGPQPNGAFEGLSLSWSGHLLVTSMEAPLYQDGADGNVNRITFYEKWSGQPVRQVAYEQDELPGNGVVEILAEAPHRYLVVERNYVEGEGNSIRVYRIDTRGATNVLGRDSLAEGDHRAVRKELLVDFADLEEQGLRHVDNIEAVSWGPKLATGERSLVFVSDDNFNDTQVSQVVALGVRR